MAVVSVILSVWHNLVGEEVEPEREGYDDTADDSAKPQQLRSGRHQPLAPHEGGQGHQHAERDQDGGVVREVEEVLDGAVSIPRPTDTSTLHPT